MHVPVAEDGHTPVLVPRGTYPATTPYFPLSGPELSWFDQLLGKRMIPAVQPEPNDAPLSRPVDWASDSLPGLDHTCCSTLRHQSGAGRAMPEIYHQWIQGKANRLAITQRISACNSRFRQNDSRQPGWLTAEGHFDTLFSRPKRRLTASRSDDGILRLRQVDISPWNQ